VTIDPMEEANVGQVFTERYDRYNGQKFLRPAFYPDAEISVTLPVPHAKPPIFMAALYVDFGDGGWTCSATGRSPREACEALRDVLSKTTH